MKRRIQTTIILAACVCAALARMTGPAGVAAVTSAPRAAYAADDPNPALNTPDKFNWQLFVQVNQKAAQQSQVGPQKVTTNNAVWETWADDADTFPPSPDPSKCGVPNPSPQNCPTWPGAAPRAKVLTPSPKETIRQQLRFQRLSNQRELLRMQSNKSGGPQTTFIEPTGGRQETRRNKFAFDFIVANSLWYTQGLRAAFDAKKAVSFPVESIEVKADWTPITAAQKGSYHWNYDAKGSLYGLVALHVISKAVPNWTWATFEWAGNVGRCDYIGCHDRFGSVPQDVQPNAQNNKGYPPGQLTPELLAMFAAAGLGPEWQNYRLKGSQTDFTDATGRATLLGNSITERGFVQTSSCMTCHAQASVDSSGLFPPDVGFDPNGQSTNGALNPQWFYNTNTNPWTPTYVPIDFVWGILRAQPAPGP